MKLKQKATLFTLLISLFFVLASVTVAIALPTSDAYAQIEPEEPGDPGACPDGTSACSPDGTPPDPANPCASLPSGYTKTREDCEQAVSDGRDPCEQIYKTLMEDTSVPEAEREADAEKRRANCESFSGSDNLGQPPMPEDKCDPSKNTCCGKVKTSIITGNFCDDGGNPDDVENSVIFELLKLALGILTAGVGIAAVGGIAYGAILYSSAENKPEQTKKAIGIITNVVIGLVAYGMMFILLNFLIPGGIFE